jgi:hypothetical protein
VAEIDRTAALCVPVTGDLAAGWAKASITIPGVPLAGFDERKGKPSTGVHDDCYVKALALSDGADDVVIVGSDMLIVPENLADAVRAQVTAKTKLKAENILLNSSHTHSGVGAWGPGYSGSKIGGEFNENVLKQLTDAFVTAIIDAHDRMEPASLGYGSVSVPEYIRNRTREAGVDSTLGFLVAAQDDGDRVVLARYSAHPTNLGAGNLEYSAEYPGYLQRAVEKKTGAFAMYLGGAVGSMGPKAPDAGDGFARAQLMGEALAEKVLESLPSVKMEKRLEIAAAGGPIEVPPMQLVMPVHKPKEMMLRSSTHFLKFMGVDNDAWFSGVRVGDLYLVGTPCDFSGELSADLHEWARTQGRELWMLSFNGDYVGYISPDKYYLANEKNADIAYETDLMSWCGPKAGSYFEDLTKHAVDKLAGGPATTVAAAANGGR